MFKGEQSITLATALPEAAVTKKVEESLGFLGRVRIDKKRAVGIDPKDKFNNFLTDTTMDGTVRKKGEGYEVTVAYSCKPTVVNWAILTVGTVACWGLNWLAILGPMMAKKGVEKDVRNVLLDIEEEVEGRS